MGVVVVAAGSGTRLGAARLKAFVELSGQTLLEHSLDGVLAAGADQVAVVVPAALVDEARALVEPLVACGCADAVVVAGGAERTDSVAAGLAALDAEVEVVLVHDAARCLTPVEVYERVVTAIRGGAAGAIPGLPVVDTIKVVDDRGVIRATPERAALRAVQTPQGFRADLLREAYAAGRRATDDAALVEALGHEVVVVDGDPRALKITTPDDLVTAERLLAVGRDPAAT